MRRQGKLVSAVAILALGGAAAFCFRKPPSGDALPGPALTPLVRHGEAGSPFNSDAAAPVPAAAAATGAPVPVESSNTAPQTSNSPPLVSLMRLEEQPSNVPELSQEYPDFSRQAIVPVAGSEPDRPKTHRIVDGDTLAALAERYLGSASRAPELFEANRRLLQDPELLPIGAELTIPSSADVSPAGAH